MSKTNCINCGAAKEISDMQCPFCGTKYADFTTFNLMGDEPIYIQMNKTGGGVITAKAYITNSTLNFEHNMLDISTVSGIKKHINAGTTVRGSIDFTLYESI